ncbi:MAG TPA: hypothetical protein PKA82_02645 [Pyrinomonadaceae bacterium]|nr:hypothetical protein [Pyrinomonadaceae bacterium]
MSRAKCPQCGLVNSIDDDTCRRCGVGLYDFSSAQKPKQARSEVNLPIGKIAIAAAVAFGIYWWTSTPATPTPPAAVAGPKPQPTLSAREEHESQKKQAYTTAIKNSGGLADHQKRTAETEKFMANTQK